MWGAVGAIGGGLISALSQGKTNKTNAARQAETNRMSAAEAARTRKFNAWQSDRAHNRNVAAAKMDRARNRQDATKAWNRSRTATLADRKDHREYNDPAAERSRLEAAGFNPLSRVDNSGGFTGSAPLGNPVAGSTAPAYAANGVAATFGTAFDQASPLGMSVANAFMAYQEGQFAEAELALRETQLDMENTRLTKLLEGATMRPTVPGIYQRRDGYEAGNQGSDRQSDLPPSLRGPAGKLFADRDVRLEPVVDLPAGADVELPSGRKLPFANPEMELEGPASWLNSGWVGGAIAVDAAGELLIGGLNAIGAEGTAKVLDYDLSKPAKGYDRAVNRLPPLLSTPVNDLWDQAMQSLPPPDAVPQRQPNTSIRW